MGAGVLRVGDGGIHKEDVGGGGGEADRGGELVGEVVLRRGHRVFGVVGALHVDVGGEAGARVRLVVLLVVPINLVTI